MAVVPNGSKYWRLKYRFHGKEKLLALGVYPEVSLSDARMAADKARKLLAAGHDPVLYKKEEKRKAQLAAENSFEAVALEWIQKQSNTWTEQHASDVKHRLETNLFTFIGNRPIAQIDALELLSAIRKIESRGSFDLAHRVLQVSGQVFRYGIATGRCTHDIAADLRGALTPHQKKHQPAIRPEELPDLIRAINGYDALGDKQTRLGLRLLALTFVRTNELIGAKWDEFDLEKHLWIIPAQRMKMKTEHIVPLSKQSLEILGELKTLAGESRFVFPGRNYAKPMSNNTMLFALYRLGYKGRMTGHGFRAVASTALNEMGFRPDVIERQLAHCERNAVRGAYNRAEYLPERKRMMQHWADYLDAAAGMGKVVRLKRA